MLGRALLATLLLMATTFAGCFGGDGGGEPIDTGDESTNESAADGLLDEEENATAPDGRGDISAFKETNRTETGAGGMEHKHDYWQGADRIDISWINSGMIPFPVWPCREGRADEGGDCYNPGTSIADYSIPPEHGMVYEGTKEVVLTATVLRGPDFCAAAVGTCTPAPPATTELNFDYITAADDPGAWRPGGTLRLNEPVTIPIRPMEADMPHQQQSLWLFRLYTTDATWIEFNITITAVRGYDVVDWPPHPDLYAETSERLIYEGSFQADSRGTTDSFLYGSDSQWFRPDKVISWGSTRVEVEVSDVTFQTQNGAPVQPKGFLLEYHNASKPPLLGHGAQYGGRLEDPSSDGSTYRFTIDLTGDEWAYDTPYAEKSRWGFRFVPNFDTAGSACVDDPFLQQFLVGCQFVPWTIEYQLKIVAYGEPLGEGFDMEM